MFEHAAQDAYIEELEETIDHLYAWLVEVVHFPFDFNFGDKPEWLNVEKLARKWHEYEGSQDSVEDYIATIYIETSWGPDS